MSLPSRYIYRIRNLVDRKNALLHIDNDECLNEDPIKRNPDWLHFPVLVDYLMPFD